MPLILESCVIFQSASSPSEENVSRSIFYPVQLTLERLDILGRFCWSPCSCGKGDRGCSNPCHNISCDCQLLNTSLPPLCVRDPTNFLYLLFRASFGLFFLFLLRYLFLCWEPELLLPLLKDIFCPSTIAPRDLECVHTRTCKKCY